MQFLILIWSKTFFLFGLIRGMLPEAVLPPSDDHTYAQWLEREDNPPSLQPSSFRHVPTSPHAFAERGQYDVPVLDSYERYFGLSTQGQWHNASLSSSSLFYLLATSLLASHHDTFCSCNPIPLCFLYLFFISNLLLSVVIYPSVICMLSMFFLVSSSKSWICSTCKSCIYYYLGEVTGQVGYTLLSFEQVFSWRRELHGCCFNLVAE